MSKTVPVYVSVNPDNSTLTEQPKSMAADGLTEMWVRPGMLNYLLENWTKYLVIDGQFKRTSDDFADLSVDHLLHENEVLNTQLGTANGQILTQGEDITALQSANKDLKAANDLTQQGLMEAVDYLSAQLAGNTTSAADTSSKAASSAAPASSAAASSEEAK